METVFNDDVRMAGNLTVHGQRLPAIARSELAEDSNARHKIQPTDWRVWDAFSQPLPSEGLVEAAVEHASYYWDPNSADDSAFVAGRAYRVVGITARVEVAGTDAGAVTAAVKKAPSGTDIAAGTALHTGTIDLKGTVNTNQALTLSATSSDLDIAAGNAIGIDFTGVLTAARGVVTVALAPAASPDDLILVGGTFGAASPSVRTRDLKAAAQTLRARCTFQLPPSYVAGATVTIRARAGMLTT
ncbi:MAG: hypothetical protein L0211_24425, partial [Planctomycetaceae bacterium]|nr:hypothetical protein [Planctomycetaceae bacterium]